MTDEVLEGEIMSESTELVVRDEASLDLFPTNDPGAVVARGVAMADALKDVVRQKGLVIKIGQSEYIKVDGWTTLGAMVGVFPQTEWSRELPDGAGWEAAVVVKTVHGAVVGRAEAQCLRAERNWKGRDDFALRSMAQTRAMGKALRMPLGWIATLAGYEATPAEEMPAAAPVERDDDVPFEPRPAAEKKNAGGGADKTSEWAPESAVTAVLELAARCSPEDHDKAADALTKHRAKYENRVNAKWLAKMHAALEEKAPAVQPEGESQFQIPASVREGVA